MRAHFRNFVKEDRALVGHFKLAWLAAHRACKCSLFGFEQGAFTGAVRSKPGKFEMANKGTIFLDEIAEMSTHLQAKLLHVLQDHQYSRLGGRHLVETDVR